MKKLLCVILAALTLTALAACGQTEPESADLTAVYADMSAELPEMLMMDESMMLDMCGISADDCAQVVAAVSYDGMRTDEIWLIEAVDEAALGRLEALAETRLKVKGQETVDYAPDQYLVVQDGQIILRGLYLALIVTPNADAAAGIFSSEVPG